MTDNDYTSGGENPGALPGLDAAARDDSVSVPRALLSELREVLAYFYGRTWMVTGWDAAADRLLARLDALLSASGPGGGD